MTLFKKNIHAKERKLFNWLPQIKFNCLKGVRAVRSFGDPDSKKFKKDRAFIRHLFNE